MHVVRKGNYIKPDGEENKRKRLNHGSFLVKLLTEFEKSVGFGNTLRIWAEAF